MRHLHTSLRFRDFLYKIVLTLLLANLLPLQSAVAAACSAPTETTVTEGGITYAVRTFTSVSANCTWSIPAGVTNIQLLIVGGGGGGAGGAATNQNGGSGVTVWGVTVAGGGGGWGGGTGGTGGGGSATNTYSTKATSGTQGTDGTGSGGGGGNDGGSGRVAIRFNADTTAPTFTSSSSFSAAENIATSANAATIKVSESATVTISSGVDASLFNLITSDSVTVFIRFKTSPNYESPSDSGGNNVYDLVLTATDSASNAGTQTITITVTDVVDTSSFNSFTLSGAASFRTVVTITANVSVASRVTFRAKNVIIPGCKNRLTSGASPNIVATCSWRPAMRGEVVLTATASPTGAGISSATATPLSVMVGNRSGSR